MCLKNQTAAVELDPDKEAFFARAREFLADTLGGSRIGQVQADTDLVRTGLLDSLLLVSFLSFLETERQAPLAGIPDFSGEFSLRTAYQLVKE